MMEASPVFLLAVLPLKIHRKECRRSFPASVHIGDYFPSRTTFSFTLFCFSYIVFFKDDTQALSTVHYWVASVNRVVNRYSILSSKAMKIHPVVQLDFPHRMNLHRSGKGT